VTRLVALFDRVLPAIDGEHACRYSTHLCEVAVLTVEIEVLEGHGLGKLLVGLALTAARKDAPAFAARIKAAAEAAIPLR
jgi:hypothetical protein